MFGLPGARCALLTALSLIAIETPTIAAPAVGAPAGKSVSPGDASRSRPAKFDIAYTRHVLPNGLTVLLHRDTRLPLVAVSVWYDVGGLHERPGRSGFAHLFEHMMFQGSPSVGPDMHFRRLQQVGATSINGTTEFDRTNYFETVPSHELELALWLESDRMGFLLNSVNQEALNNQIDVVKNERRQSVENAPYGLMEELITKTLYPPNHPYHGNVIGSMEDLTNASLDDVKEFFLTYYTPANATLAIAGDIDLEATKGLVEKYFGSIKGLPKPSVLIPDAPRIDGEKIIRYDEPVGKLAKLSMVWMAPSIFAPDTAALDLLTHVISGTRSARLDRKVTFDDLIAQSVTARFSPNKSGSTFVIELMVQPGRTLEEAHLAVDAVLADFAKKPPTKLELTRALNSEETGTYYGLELLGGRAEILQTYNLYLGNPGKLNWDLERYRKVTPKDLARVMKTYLNSNRLIVYGRPAVAAEEK